jgi:hypothetical protein
LRSCPACGREAGDRFGRPLAQAEDIARLTNPQVRECRPTATSLMPAGLLDRLADGSLQSLSGKEHPSLALQACVRPHKPEAQAKDASPQA